MHDSELNKFTKDFLEKCEIIQIKSWKVEQAITMFNSLNSDGLPLYDSDIISAKLYAVAESKGKSDEFLSLWKQLKYLSNVLDEKGIGNLDSLLMQHMYYERASRRETITDRGKVNVTTPGLRRYFTDIKNSSLLSDPIELINKLINLAEIWLKVSNYPQVQVLFKFNENFKLFLASYFYRFDSESITETDVNPIVKCFIRLFAILEMGNIGYSSSKFKTFLFGEEVKLVDSSIGAAEIEEDFGKHIRSNWKIDDIESMLNDYDGYAIVYLNDFIYAENKGMSFNLSSPHDVEHIMPCSGKNLSEIRNDADIADEEEFKNIVNKLGNKIVLEQKINRAISNEWFRTKISTKFKDKTGYVDSKYPIAIKIVEHYKDITHPYWKKDDILSATEKAVSRIADYIFN